MSPHSLKSLSFTQRVYHNHPINSRLCNLARCDLLQIVDLIIHRKTILIKQERDPPETDNDSTFSRKYLHLKQEIIPQKSV